MNFGIICEFNPFHKGHKYLFDKAREFGAKNIICAMSGNAVQRGDLAICDKYERAKSALQNGADLVLELPFPWSASSAEYFATAGIKILSAYCDAVIFGSECGDIELLTKAANIALSNEFCEQLERRKKDGEGAAAAYFSLLGEAVGTKLSSNDILGVEYIKSAKKCGVKLEFFTVRRMGNAYRDNNIYEGEIPSASAIRRAIRDGDDKELSRIESYTENTSISLLDHTAFTDVELLDRALLMYFRLSEPTELSQYAEADGGIAERICSAAKENADIECFWNSVKTKRYTDAKLCRAMLFCITKVKRELLSQSPQYIYLLAANESGRKLLALMKKSGNDNYIPIVTKPADVPRDSLQFAVEERLNAVFSLARKNAASMSEAYRKTAFVIK